MLSLSALERAVPRSTRRAVFRKTQLALYIQQRIKPNETVEWWGRRAVFEIMEEVGAGLFWFYIVASFWHMLDFHFHILEEAPRVLAVALITSGVPLLYPLWEYGRWKREIYVVTRNDDPADAAKGTVYKFTGRGIYEAQFKPTVIDSKWPEPTAFEPAVRYAIWRFLTGERMEGISLASPSGQGIIVGNRISPDFINTILNVQGSPARPRVSQPGDIMSSVWALERLRQLGLDEKLIEQAGLRLLYTHFYGDQ